jgi:hypothetical protein
MGAAVDHAARPAEGFARGILRGQQGAVLLVEASTCGAYAGPGPRIQIELPGPEYAPEISALGTGLRVLLSRQVTARRGLDREAERRAGPHAGRRGPGSALRLCCREPAPGAGIPERPGAGGNLPPRRGGPLSPDGALPIRANRLHGHAARRIPRQLRPGRSPAAACPRRITRPPRLLQYRPLASGPHPDKTSCRRAGLTRLAIRGCMPESRRSAPRSQLDEPLEPRRAIHLRNPAQ